MSKNAISIISFLILLVVFASAFLKKKKLIKNLVSFFSQRGYNMHRMLCRSLFLFLRRARKVWRCQDEGTYEYADG